MGLLMSVISKFRKKLTTKEKLIQIDENIDKIQSLLNKNRQQQRTAVIFLITISLVSYFLAVGILYLFYLPVKWFDRLLYIVPFLVFPALVVGLKKILHFYFVTRITKNGRQLDELKKEKKKILENAMETETYKVAKEILEKFDPNRKLVEKEKSGDKPDGTPGQELRKRNVGPNSVMRQQPGPRGMTPGQNGMPRMINSGGMRTPMHNAQQFQHTPMIRGPAQFRPAITPNAPILPRDRSLVDKVAEYFIGDGPSNRYALICKQCFSHNGMALAEEFVFTSYKCCYCGVFNPARQQRLNAPRLEQHTPVIRQQSTTSSKDETDGDSHSEGEPKSNSDGEQTSINKENIEADEEIKNENENDNVDQTIDHNVISENDESDQDAVEHNTDEEDDQSKKDT